MAVDWLKIKTDYLKNPELSLEKAAVKHKVAASYLKYIASRDKWFDQKKEIGLKADQKMTEAMPETIAQIKLRHARIGRNLQSIGMSAMIGEKALRPNSAGEAINAMVKGVNIERQALGLNEKEVQDEVYQKFSQFTFIFNLNGTELQNFVKSAIARGSSALGAPSQPIPNDTGEEAARVGVVAPTISGQSI